MDLYFPANKLFPLTESREGNNDCTQIMQYLWSNKLKNEVSRLEKCIHLRNVKGTYIHSCPYSTYLRPANKWVPQYTQIGQIFFFYPFELVAVKKTMHLVTIKKKYRSYCHFPIQSDFLSNLVSSHFSWKLIHCWERYGRKMQFYNQVVQEKKLKFRWQLFSSKNQLLGVFAASSITTASSTWEANISSVSTSECAVVPTNAQSQGPVSVVIITIKIRGMTNSIKLLWVAPFEYCTIVSVSG